MRMQLSEGALMAKQDDRDLLEVIKAMRSYFNSFAEDGVRPDEWIMREWVTRCDRAIAKAEAK